VNDALYIAATGMQAHQKGVETIANNLTNVNTPGYKKTRASFGDLVYRPVGAAEALPGQDALMAGSGVGITSFVKSFSQGALRVTGSGMDLAINGAGFIQVAGADGAPAYVRGGSLMVDKDGLLCTADGMPLQPAIRVGNDVADLAIGADGRVSGRLPGGSGMSELGRIELARFSNVQGLETVSGNVYRATERSGEAILGTPGEDGAGLLAQGQLEASNVDLSEEMVDLMVAQRAYESSVKVIQAADEMLAMSNNLRK
jgi:flagellar basal-body rod protein FlgG